jgi:PAS domain S-box-containing protein
MNAPFMPVDPMTTKPVTSAFSLSDGEAEAYLRALIEASSDAVVIASEDGVIVHASEPALRFFQQPAEVLLGHRIEDLIDLGGDGFLGLLRAIAGGAVTDLRIKRPDGMLQDIEVKGASASYLGRHLLILRDVSARKRVEKALRHSERRLSTALEIGRMGAYRVKMGTDEVWWSAEMYSIVGLEPGAVTPTKEMFRELVHPDDWDELMQARAASIEQHQPLVHEFRVIRPDGEVRWLSNRAQTDYDEGGAPQHHFGVALDVTERRRNEEALREQARLLHEADVRKNEFLAMLAHELRGPLAPIRSAARFLEMAKSSDATMARAGSMIDRHVRHMTRLVDDLLDMARVSTGKVRLRREMIDLVQVMRQGLEMSQPLLDSKSHHVTLSLPEHPVMIDGDATRLAQVVCNLLDNAAKYTDAQGEISLNLALETQQDGPSHAVLCVTDNGRGIAASALTSLFELFYQADRNLDRAEGGLGIGLSLVRDLVRLHDGEIEATSAGLGRGSMFTVTLPIKAVPAQDDAAVIKLVASEVTEATQRVLIVDDNPDSADSLALLVAMDGHTTRTAHEGSSAINQALEWQPDVILLDLGLPGTDGFEVCRRLRSSGLSKVRIIAVTGYGENDARERTKAAGFDAHLVKPVDASMLEQYLSASQR